MPKATLRLVMGPDFPQMTANLHGNLADGDGGAVQAVFEKFRPAVNGRVSDPPARDCRRQLAIFQLPSGCRHAVP